jgi:hypothetical protein
LNICLKKTQKKSFINIFKLLKTGGRFIVGFPHNTKDKIFHRTENEVSLGHINFLIHEDFIKYMEETGFKLISFTPGYSIKSSYRMSKELREKEIYKRIKSRLGGFVARAVMMSIVNEFTGGGYYVFEKGIKNV